MELVLIADLSLFIAIFEIINENTFLQISVVGRGLDKFTSVI